MINFIKNTAIGGLLFMIPIVVVAVILKKAYQIMVVIAVPLDKLIPIEEVGGVALVNILAVIAVLFVCFFAGLAARSRAGKAAFHWIDAKLLAVVPGYTYLKSITGSFSDETDEMLKPILMKLDDQAQLAFLVERTADNLVIAYCPGSPDARSGPVVCLTPDRVEPLNISFTAVSQSLRRYGRGSAALLSAGESAKAISTEQ